MKSHAGSPKSSMLACCFNPRVLIGTAVAIGGVAVIAPGLLHSVGPYLLYLICPLSMLLMMWAMNRSGGMIAPPSNVDQSALLAEMRELHEMESRYLALKALHSGSGGAPRGSETAVDP